MQSTRDLSTAVVTAQLNTPAMTALSHGKQREEAHASHARPATPSPTPRLLYSLRATKEGRLSGRLEPSGCVWPHTHQSSASRPQVVTAQCPICSMYSYSGKKTNIIFFNVVVGPPGPDCPYEPRRVLIVVRVNVSSDVVYSFRFKTLTPTVRVLM